MNSMYKKRVIIANWKMKANLAETIELAKKYREVFADFKKEQVAICPNFISLKEVRDIISGSVIKLGAQSVFWEERGAYTGEVSPGMLKEAGCEYVIVGHSERRKYLHETYEMIHQKVKAVLNSKDLVPVVCIGEEGKDRKTEKRDFVLVDQIQQALGGIDVGSGQQIIVAYEPIWAIGSGIAIEPEEANYAHKIVRLTLNELFGEKVATENFSIIYGGSISSKNVDGFFELEYLDGLLVGGASLDVEEFKKVAQAILH
jgi:triosephosphate isomerase (TIM)